MATRSYCIESRNEAIVPFVVRATSFSHAACIGARHMYGRKRGMVAQQVTGDSGRSGYFQAYVPMRQNSGLTSFGRNYHVRTA